MQELMEQSFKKKCPNMEYKSSSEYISHLLNSYDLDAFERKRKRKCKNQEMRCEHI